MKRHIKHSLLILGLALCLIAPNCPGPGAICRGYQGVLDQFAEEVLSQVPENLIPPQLMEEYQVFGKGQLLKASDDIESICTRYEIGGTVGEFELSRTICQGNAGITTVLHILTRTEVPEMAAEWQDDIRRYQKWAIKKLAKEKP